MDTVIRFIVLYQLNTPVTHKIEKVILSVGYTQGGHDHAGLMDLYSPERMVCEVKAGERVYAGYLYIDDSGNIKINQEDAGSSTLGIEKDVEEAKKFINAVIELPRLKQAITEMYPLIALSKVTNVMLSANQKSD